MIHSAVDPWGQTVYNAWSACPGTYIVMRWDEQLPGEHQPHADIWF